MNKRSLFIINPGFQVRLSLIICGFVFISSLIYPLIFLDTFDEIAKIAPEYAAQYKQIRNDLIFFLAGIQTLLILVIFIFSMFVSHKIAGPLFKLKKYLGSIRNGEIYYPLSFRNKDYFHDVAEEVNLFLETVSLNQENDFEYIDEVGDYLNNLSTIVPEDKKPVINEIIQRLKQIKSRYESSV